MITALNTCRSASAHVLWARSNFRAYRCWAQELVTLWTCRETEMISKCDSKDFLQGLRQVYIRVGVGWCRDFVLGSANIISVDLEWFMVRLFCYDQFSMSLISALQVAMKEILCMSRPCTCITCCLNTVCKSPVFTIYKAGPIEESLVWCWLKFRLEMTVGSGTWYGVGWGCLQSTYIRCLGYPAERVCDRKLYQRLQRNPQLWQLHRGWWWARRKLSAVWKW